MARIAYILLCHKDPDVVIEQARRLTAKGDYMAIHFDARASAADMARIRDALADNASVVFPKRRVRCGWGEWSLVRATLDTLRAAEAAFPRATHFYLMSGDCMPIKSARFIHAFLDSQEKDFIECFDFFQSNWIKTGIKEERLFYRHFFNERARKGLFYASMELQKRLKLQRKPPADLQVMIGSQWWCLRRLTVEAVLDFCRRRRDVLRFFATTWIPDETFFQTLVHHLVPEAEIEKRTLTFLLFTDYGMPVTFHDDHYDLLTGQQHLFARKMSPFANSLRPRLGALYDNDGAGFDIADDGAAVFGFLTGRGRVGRRYAPRLWQSGARIGPGRELLVVVCKKWHVAKRLMRAIHRDTGVDCIDYLFDENDTALPDLGGIQSSSDKRNRDRATVLRMVFEALDTHRLAICVDPSRIDALRDFYGDGCITRTLEIKCTLSDAYLSGHAQRIGLAHGATHPATLAQLIPSLRQEMVDESDRLRDSGFDHFHCLQQDADAAENAVALARFLSIPIERARALAQDTTLFAD